VLKSVFDYATNQPNSDVGDRLLASFQHDIICDQFAPYRYDSATVNAVHIDERFVVSELSSLCFQIDDRLAIEYENVSAHDPFTPLSSANPGRMVSSDFGDLIDETKLKNPYFFHAHNFGIGDGFLLSFLCPGHTRFLLGLEYHQSIGNLTGAVADKEAIEQASFPFALAWMYRRRMIDEGTLRQYLKLLGDLSVMELHRLRMYINSPAMSLTTQAAALGLGARRYKESLYRIRDKVTSRLVAKSHERFKSLRPVADEYAFLKMMGNPTQDLLVPDQ